MTNKIQLVSNRVEIAQSYLLSQFRDKPNILALVSVFVEQLQEIENTLIELQNVRTLNGSYGIWLDNIGQELDTARNGFNDADYKTLLKIEMFKKSMSATIENIIKVLSLISNDTDLSVTNPDKYMIEVVGYLIEVKQSMVNEIVKLFPINTRKLIIRRDTKPFKLGTSGRGFGSGSTLNSILLQYSGIDSDKRFVSIPTEEYISSQLTPNVITLPYIFGIGEVGQTLIYTDGSYSGQTPLTITKQWQVDGVDVVGETTNAYSVLEDDAGKTITVKTTVSNTNGQIIVYTNSVIVSEILPPDTGLVVGIGLNDFNSFKLQAYDGNIVTATQSITFNYNGSITFTRANGTTFTSAYLTDVGDHHGTPYGVRYSVIEGNALNGLPPNVTHTLSTSITTSQSVSSRNSDSVAGRYRFTIFKLDDPSATQTKDIYMSVTLERDL
jgi:hypothetical protein